MYPGMFGLRYMTIRLSGAWYSTLWRVPFEGPTEGPREYSNVLLPWKDTVSGKVPGTGSLAISLDLL